MAFSVKTAIRERKSVRSYDGRPLSEEDRAALAAFLEEVQNPFGVEVTFRLLEAKANNLSSPVILGAETYLAAKVARGKLFEVGYGYSFEAFCLYAQSRGIGTVMLGGSLNRSAFEKAMALGENEVMPVASPVGYPAEKRSLRENLMRRGLKADERLPFEKLFFRETFGQGLPKAEAGDFAEALEMLRWAPSAINRQPWRAVVCGDTIHFYEESTLADGTPWDVQKVDIGIALAHFDMTMQEENKQGAFIEADPNLPLPPKTAYIVSYKKH